jgi:hypothetical protein
VALRERSKRKKKKKKECLRLLHGLVADGKNNNLLAKVRKKNWRAKQLRITGIVFLLSSPISLSLSLRKYKYYRFTKQ